MGCHEVDRPKALYTKIVNVFYQDVPASFESCLSTVMKTLACVEFAGVL
jgi:hypothetical protein